MQFADPPEETLPSLHCVQDAAPSNENMPEGHGLHSLAHAPAWEPAAQAVHLKLPAVEKLPGPLW